MEWFPNHQRGPTSDLSATPPPLLLAVSQDAQGLLWSLIAVADPNWKSALEYQKHPDEKPLKKGEPAPKRLVVGDLHKYYDTLIEVIDPARGVVVARGKADMLLQGFADTTHAISYRDDRDGVPYIDVWQLRFTPPNPDRSSSSNDGDGVADLKVITPDSEAPLD